MCGSHVGLIRSWPRQGFMGWDHSCSHPASLVVTRGIAAEIVTCLSLKGCLSNCWQADGKTIRKVDYGGPFLIHGGFASLKNYSGMKWKGIKKKLDIISTSKVGDGSCKREKKNTRASHPCATKAGSKTARNRFNWTSPLHQISSISSCTFLKIHSIHLSRVSAHI